MISEATREAGTGLPVRLEDVSVRFPAAAGTLEALGGLSLEIPANSLTVVIGPNGSGKSTLLRVIAGLIAPGEGRVLIGEGVGAEPRAGDGRVGLAFQQPRLVPWLTILDNVALAMTFKLPVRVTTSGLFVLAASPLQRSKWRVPSGRAVSSTVAPGA